MGSTNISITPQANALNPEARLSFSQSDLNILNQLPFAHNIGKTPSSVQVWDNNGVLFMPDTVKIVDANTLLVTLTSFVPLQGLYQLIVKG